MSHIHQGPLATYNSLADSHLSGYFSNGRMKRHLKKAGLVNKQGEIVSESTYRLNMSRKEHKKQVKDMLAQAIVHKTLDLERTRQAEIKRKLEEISKIQLVHRVRDERTKVYEETVLPLLSPRCMQGQSMLSGSARGKRTPRSLSTHTESATHDRVLYLDDDGRPMTPANVEHALSGEQSHIDPRHLHTLDTAAIRKYAMLMSQMEEGRGVTSPYMMSQVPLPPKARLSSRPLLSSRRVQSASPKRAVITTDSRIARLHRPETAKAHPGDLQTMCRVAMKYHGWALNLAREKMDPTQEVVVEQQHCGGNTLTVFKERLTPGSTFEFVSYRHRGYPFSLTLYLDGQMDSRVSTCCEYRHSRGAKIGGKQGHFSLLGVEGAIPCYKCQVAKGVLVRNKATPRRAKRPSERHVEEVIVVSTKKDEDHKDDSEVTEWRTKQGRPVGEDEGAVLIPVEDDDNHGDKTPKSPADKDTTYDDDFDDDKSSASSRSSSSSASDSETDSSTRQRDEVKKPQRKKEHFQPQETRGEEREAAPTPPPPPPAPAPATKAGEEEEGQKRGGDGRGSQQVKVSNTNREIDDYSSDDGDEDPKAKVIDMENIEADDNQRVQQLRSRVSSSSSSTTTTTTKPPPEEERGTDNTVISVDLLDKQERDDEHARRDRERRAEERHKEEEDLLQRREERRASVRRASEVLRQEELFQHQQREQEQERQKKEKSKRQKDEEKELYQTQPDLETKRQVTMVLDRSDSDETDRGDKYDASHDRNLEAVESKNQVRAELDEIIDSYTEQLEKVEEGESEDEEEETEDDYKEKSEVSREEKSYDSQPESLTARSSRSAASSSSSRMSSTSDVTNRQIPTARSSAPEEDASDADEKEREEEQREEEERKENQTQQNKDQHPSSKTDATLLGQNLTANNNNDDGDDTDTAPPRAPSPFPPPAVYLHRRDTRNMEEAVVVVNTTLGSQPTTNSPPLSRPSSPTPPKSTTTTTSPPPSPSSPPLSPEPPQTDSALSPEASGVSPAEEDSPRATSPFPSAAVYEGRPKRDARPDDSSLSVSSWEREHPPVRARSPFPPAAVYEDRPRRGRGEEEGGGGEGGSLK